MSTQAQKISQADFEKHAAAVEQTLTNELYIPAFIKSAAARGINITTQDELDNALQIVEMYEAAGQSQNSGLLKQAAADLRTHLGQRGVVTPHVDAGRTAIVKQAAAHPSIRQALMNEIQLRQYAEAGLVA